MKSDYFHGLFKHGATGATGATETKNPNNNADLALPNGVAQNKNERATGATKPISAHHPVALVAQTKKAGATEGASLEAWTGAASGEVLPVLPQKLSDIRTTHIDLSEGRIESAGNGIERTVPSTPGQAADVSVAPGLSRGTDVPSTPIKHTRRRALASAPPPHPMPSTVHYAARAFLYSVIRDGVVERATLVSQNLKTEPEALVFLKQRFPWLKVQWARLITHPVCSGCRHYTGGVLCNADQSPDYAAVVGSCGRYVQAGEL